MPSSSAPTRQAPGRPRPPLRGAARPAWTGPGPLKTFRRPEPGGCATGEPAPLTAGRPPRSARRKILLPRRRTSLCLAPRDGRVCCRGSAQIRRWVTVLTGSAADVPPRQESPLPRSRTGLPAVSDAPRAEAPAQPRGSALGPLKPVPGSPHPWGRPVKAWGTPDSPLRGAGRPRGLRWAGVAGQQTPPRGAAAQRLVRRPGNKFPAARSVAADLPAYGGAPGPTLRAPRREFRRAAGPAPGPLKPVPGSPYPGAPTPPCAPGGAAPRSGVG